MAGFVVCGHPAFGFVHDAAALLAPPRDFVAGFVEIGHVDAVFVFRHRNQRSFVDDVFQVRAAESRRRFGEHREIDFGREFHAFAVHAQNLFAPFDVRQINIDVAVEAPRRSSAGSVHVGSGWSLP